MALAGILGFLLGAELLFRLLPVSTATLTDYHLDPRLLSYPPRHRWTTATGWDLRNVQTLTANNVGFLSSRDFVRDPTAVALIGDSYVEASALDIESRLAPQIEVRLRATPVYAMGSPGTSLLDYAERIRWSAQTFGVRQFVLLLEAGDVVQSLCGSGNSDGPCLDPVSLEPRFEPKPSAGLLKQWLRHSALAQYVFSQLKADPARLWQQFVDQSRPAQGHDVGKPAASRGHSAKPADLRLVDAVVDEFLVRASLPGQSRLIVVLDDDRLHLGRAALERQRLSTRLRSAGAVVIDAAPLYAEHRARSTASIEVGPYDKHLNEIGLSLLASAIAPALQAARP